MKKFIRTQPGPAPPGPRLRAPPPSGSAGLSNGHVNSNGNGNGHVLQNGHHYPHNGQQNGHVANTQYHVKSVKANGHANGVANGRTWMNGFASKPEDKQSTLSRYWTAERPRAGVSHYQAVRRACREQGVLWEDPDFPPGPRALYKYKKPALQPIVWMRPHEMCQCPIFGGALPSSSSADLAADDSSEADAADSLGTAGRLGAAGRLGSSGRLGSAARLNAEAGELGDPWLLGAAASLALTPRFLERVVPQDQDFDENYCGMFRFRFWHFGEWKEILVDDRLPTFRGRLVYVHSSTTTEFWAALMEKAYAKLYGNYENLLNGSTTRSLQDLTGGIVQSFGLSHQDRYLTFQVLNSAVPRSSLLIATITPEKDKRQLRLRNGLMTQHAYSVTGLARVRGQNGETPLVRLRNPWGRGEWAGAWSAASWEWHGLSDRDRDLLSLRVVNDGEFWMSFDDFSRHFTQLELVHVGPDDWMSEPALHSKQPWRAVLARRRWRAGYNAGGGPHFTETTAMNPQFHVQIPRATSNKCHVVVSVTQHYDTRPADGKKKSLVAIGFAVYEVPHNMPRLTPHFVSDQKPLDVTNHSIAREVVTFFTLPPGDYIVVPQTNMPNIDGKFLLRIFTDEQSNIWEVNEDNMVVRNISAEFMDDNTPMLPETKMLLSKLLVKYPPEVDAAALQKILRSHWKQCLLERPSLELCRSLIMLRDHNISGRLHLPDIPPLMHMLHFWKMAFQKYAGSQCGGKTSSYRLRPLLREAGAAVSNKVLECLVLRFAKSRVLTAEAYIMAMVRLHLAHERYHSLDTKMKTNPLSLEEMILMTIYS